MNGAVDDTLRERITRLEVQVEHLNGKLDEQTVILKRLDVAFERAKGAQWLVLAAAGLAGFLAGKGPSIMAWLGFTR